MRHKPETCVIAWLCFAVAGAVVVCTLVAGWMIAR